MTQERCRPSSHFNDESVAVFLSQYSLLETQYYVLDTKISIPNTLYSILSLSQGQMNLKLTPFAFFTDHLDMAIILVHEFFDQVET